MKPDPTILPGPTPLPGDVVSSLHPTPSPVAPGTREPDRPTHVVDGKGMLNPDLVGQPRGAGTPVLRAPDTHPDRYATLPLAGVRHLIPAGLPADVAEKLVAARVPVSDAIAIRLEQICRDVLIAQEDCRNYPGETRHTVRNFVTFTGQLLAEKRKLLLKVGADPGTSVEAQVTDLVLSIARWSNGEEIRVHRARHAGYLRGELAQVGSSMQSILDPNSTYAGPLQQEAALKKRTTEMLTVRDAIQTRLDRLDGGDVPRGTAISLAIGAAGGVKSVAQKIAPLMPDTSVPGRTVSIRDDIASVQAQLSMVDPQTLRAAGLREHIQRLELEAKGNLTADTAARRKRAEGILSDCAAGGLDSLQVLAPMASTIGPAFEASVRTARGNPEELVATIAEILERHQLQLQAMTDRKAALTFATGID
jgi:hypothetical protein